MGDAGALRTGDGPPILRMYWPEIDQIVERWQWNGRANSSLLCILRGVPGSGKSSFATLLKLAVESAGMTAEICSEDNFFRSPGGYRFVHSKLNDARANCLEYVKGALRRRVNVVIVDNTNLRPNDWETYERLTFERPVLFGPTFYVHGILRVNFQCDSLQHAYVLSDRTNKDIPRSTTSDQYTSYINNVGAFRPAVQLQAIANTWSTDFGPPTREWEESERYEPLQWQGDLTTEYGQLPISAARKASATNEAKYLALYVSFCA